MDVTKQAPDVKQNQRTRICNRAAEHLENVISLYDFGVFLDILAADSRLRNLLIHACTSFRNLRFADISDTTHQADWNQE